MIGVCSRAAGEVDDFDAAAARSRQVVSASWPPRWLSYNDRVQGQVTEQGRRCGHASISTHDRGSCTENGGWGIVARVRREEAIIRAAELIAQIRLSGRPVEHLYKLLRQSQS